MWARSLEEYIQRAQGFHSGWYGDYFYEKFFDYVSNWRTHVHDVSGDELLKLLIDHRQGLLELRKDYAAVFVSGQLGTAAA